MFGFQLHFAQLSLTFTGKRSVHFKRAEVPTAACDCRSHALVAMNAVRGLRSARPATAAMARVQHQSKVYIAKVSNWYIEGASLSDLQ